MRNKKIIIIISIIVFSILTIGIIGSTFYFSYHMQIDNENDLLKESSEEAVMNFAKSHAVLNELEANFTRDIIDVNKHEKNFLYLKGITEVYDNVLIISIHTPDASSENGFTVNISSDPNLLNKPSSEYHKDSYNSGHTFYIIEENDPIITIISPINVSGEIIATQELVLIMNPPAFSHRDQIQFFIIAAFIGSIILICSFLIILKVIIVKYSKNETYLK